VISKEIPMVQKRTLGLSCFQSVEGPLLGSHASPITRLRASVIGLVLP